MKRKQEKKTKESQKSGKVRVQLCAAHASVFLFFIIMRTGVEYY